MNLQNFFKIRKKENIGKLIIILAFFLGILLFFNRFELVFYPDVFDLCIKENVKFLKSGIFQKLRSFFEHLTFNFLFPLFLVIFNFGFDKLIKKYSNWKISFFIGAASAILITLIWEIQKIPFEWIEMFIDFIGIFLCYSFLKWQLKE